MTTATKEVTQQGQYLTFLLAGEEYAISILKVKEIIEYDTVTRVPNTPECVRGVMNLRGSVVPVIDLAVKFGQESSEIAKLTCLPQPSVLSVTPVDPAAVPPGTPVSYDVQITNNSCDDASFNFNAFPSTPDITVSPNGGFSFVPAGTTGHASFSATARVASPNRVHLTDELLNLEEVAAAASTPEAAASETVAETVTEEDSAKTAESPADSESKTRNAK